jgi:hypothetical protein
LAAAAAAARAALEAGAAYHGALARDGHRRAAWEHHVHHDQEGPALGKERHGRSRAQINLRGVDVYCIYHQ